MVDPLLKGIAIAVEILYRPGRDTALHCGHRDGRRDGHDESRVERFGNQIVGTELEIALTVCRRHDLGLLGHREIGKRVGCRDLHLLVDLGGAHVQRSAKDERETEHIVDLVRIVRSSGGNHCVGADAFRFVRHDLGRRIREREDERLRGHLLHHLRLEDTARRQAEKHVCADNHVREPARVGAPREAQLVRVHLLLATLVHDARDVGDPDVLQLQPERHQEVETRERRGAGTRRDEPYLAQFLADHPQPVENRRADGDGGAMLIVVKDRDTHAAAQLALDVEAFGRLDVLEVDAAEGGFEGSDDFDHPVGVALVELDVEHVDARELLEEYALAFHHRLGCQRADRAEAEDGRPVRDHADQVGACSQVGRLGGVTHDLLARHRDPRRIGEREIALVDERLGWRDRYLSGTRQPVIFKRRGA